MNKKIKFGFLWSIILSSTIAITFPIFGCSLFSDLTKPGETIILTSVDYSKAREALGSEIIKEMKSLGNFEKQQALAEEWKIGVKLSDTQKLTITNNLHFVDSEGNKYENDLVIDSIVFNSNATVYQVQFTSSVGTYAKGIKVKINFKKGYYALNLDSLFAFEDLIIGS
ncbi:MAG: hypothetical protein ACRDCF_01265 [Mycoplasmoidaceae bacterium]